MLKIILIALAFASLQAYAKDGAHTGRNLLVKESSSAGKRIALVIGNSKYQSDSLPKLANPAHDAEDIAKVLRGFGFEVIEKKDLSLEGMNNAIAEFGRKIGDSDAALFYYAGHGLQVKGQNYLVPVNAKIDSEAQVPYQSINVNQLLDEMDNGKSRANIVMLDACRNNPISGKFRSGATRGLAPVTSSPKGTVIVYATDPGNEAADGAGRNGLFTAGLLTAFKGNDLSLHGVLVRTSEEVERGSKQKQTPYVNGPMTLQKNFQFAPGQAATHARSREEIEQDARESEAALRRAQEEREATARREQEEREAAAKRERDEREATARRVQEERDRQERADRERERERERERVAERERQERKAEERRVERERKELLAEEERERRRNAYVPPDQSTIITAPQMPVFVLPGMR